MNRRPLSLLAFIIGAVFFFCALEGTALGASPYSEMVPSNAVLSPADSTPAEPVASRPATYIGPGEPCAATNGKAAGDAKPCLSLATMPASQRKRPATVVGIDRLTRYKVAPEVSPVQSQLKLQIPAYQGGEAGPILWPMASRGTLVDTPWLRAAGAGLEDEREATPDVVGTSILAAALTAQLERLSTAEKTVAALYDPSAYPGSDPGPPIVQSLKAQYTPAGEDRLCRTPDDQAPASITAARPASAIRYIVVHSTGGGNPRQGFQAVLNYALAGRTCFWAHYYIGKDGTVVRVTPDLGVAYHIRANGVLGVNNYNSIGIELFNTCNSVPCKFDDPYSGQQIAALVSLMESLLRQYPGITRPSAAGRGNIVMHQEIDPKRRSDPAGNFRTAAMGSPSLESVIYQALRRDRGGKIVTRGGAGLSDADHGDGGRVILEYGALPQEVPTGIARPSLIVPLSQTVTIPATTKRLRLAHLLVEGTLRCSGDLDLGLYGVLYVGPRGRIVSAGAGPGADGHSLTITANGFALIEGQVVTSGLDSYTPGQRAGSAGNFILRTSAAEPVELPATILGEIRISRTIPQALPMSVTPAR